MTAAALAAVAIAAPSASAAGVVVRLPGREVRLDETTLRGAADVPAGTATLRAEAGTGDTIAHPAAVSLPRVLELAGVAPDALSFVAVRRPNGTLSVLRAPDLARPAPFPDGPPLVWLDADSVRYLRPVRDDADVNGADNVATAGDDLVVRVHQGPLLQVAVRVRPAAPRAGERTHLEAQVAGARTGAAVTVRWRFGDGGEATGPAVAHRWQRPGRYVVMASAEGEDDSGGASEPLVVTVGAARERRGPAGGGDGDRDRAPATGQREPPEDPATSPPMAPATPVAPAARSGRPPSAPAPTGRPPSTGRPPAPAGQPPSAAGAPAATPAPGRRSRRAGSRPAAPRRERRASRAAPGTVPVRGVLVAATLPAAVPPARPAGAPPVAARAGALAGRTDLTVPAGTALTAGLLALGAWRERRRRPR